MQRVNFRPSPGGQNSSAVDKWMDAMAGDLEPTFTRRY
jgi:hypothetical protein